VARHHSQAWRRNIELSIPLRERAFWDENIKHLLQDCLDLVTGDVWQISFSEGRKPLVVNPQAPLQLKSQSISAMPFSDGLDSLAAARLHAIAYPDDTLVLVTSGSKRDADRAFRIKGLNGRRHRVAVPFHLPKSERFRHIEPTYRSRGFVFNVIVAAAAYLLEARRVIVPESGQGSLGPALAPIGNEAPDMRMHPVFTHRLSVFLERALGRAIQFEHPHLWQTKGQTLERLRKEQLDADWWETRSCARDQRHVRLEGYPRIQCGICAACLLRRQSLRAAGLDAAREPYLWPNLKASRLQDAGAAGARVPRKNDIDQAYCAVLASEDLARFAGNSGSRDTIAMAAVEVAEALNKDINGTMQNIEGLLKRHRDEWHGFVGDQGSGSFVAEWVEMARC
jgi:7-cyano-7-deazaguanine synthase in queuosine biosynthesis